ncbi:hypothetical protein E1301_Tti005004 [Triplophysa tibetana]|uniref:Uncharacterized protein n=1 Tax=Triplophysa tibetana TaxID=1572043 RepID=A0A5A9NWX0_9TELE|nr:hypothetical protein E1301_Tti005004 [Triplophysa tibetana]
MSGKRSKKKLKFGSSRRGNGGLRVNEEKDNEFDGPDEVHTTNPSDDTVSEAQFDLLPSLKTDNQTTALECSPRAESPIQKASDMEDGLPERKRKIGSTRKKAGGFKNVRNLEPCDEVRTSEEFGEEQENQLNTSTTEEEHTYQTKNEQQTQRSGSGGEVRVEQNIMVTVSQSKETDAIHHQEISSYSQTSSFEAGMNMAMEQSTDQYNVVTMAKTDHETPLVSTVQKRKMGSTRRPLGGNREQNRENVEAEELFRNTTDDVWKAEVKSSEAGFSMLEEMMQTWDDVKRTSPTNTSSHTESAFVSSQPLSSELTEELNVSVETETNNQSVACSVVDSTKPPSDKFGNHENLFLNKELVCFKLGLETDNHAGDFKVFQNLSDSPLTQSENFLEEVGGFSDTYQDVPDSRHNTSEDFGSVTLVETEEEPCRIDPNIIISSSKQDTKIDKLVVNVEEPLFSPSPPDVATKYGVTEIPTDVLTAEVSRISETHESDITHAEPTKIESTPKITDPGPDRHGLEDEVKETLMETITSGQERKIEKEYTQSKRLEHKEENMNIPSTDDFVEQEIQSDMQQGKTRKRLQKHSANETNVSDSSQANISPVTEHLHNVNMNLSSLLPEDSKLSGGVMVETVVSSGLNDLIINNQVSHAIVPEAENQDIYVEIKEENDIDVIERSITCDVTVTENVMDVENFTERSVDPQTLATRESENVGTETGPETDALEIKDRDNVENNAKDDMIMQKLKNDREKEKDEGDTKDREKQPGSQIQGRPSRVDPDKESFHFFQDTSVENAEESLLNAKLESAFDREGKTCGKYKMIEGLGGHEKMDASAVTILDVAKPLANIPDKDIRMDLLPEKDPSHINFEALMQDAVTEISLESSAVSEQSEISIIPEDSQGDQKQDGDSEGVAEKDKGLEFQEQNNVMDQNIKQTMMVVQGDEHEMTEKVRRSTQELCDDEADKAEGHAEITSEQQQRSSLNISQKQDGPPQDDSENMLESEAKEMFLRANTVHPALERMIKTNDESKEIEEDFKETEAAEHLTNVNIQDNANQSYLETENPEQNKVLTEGQNNTSPHINLEELQESENAKNVNDMTDYGLSFEDSGESHKELENIIDIPEDSQKEEKQSKIKPLLHKRKMKGSKGERKDKEQDAECETLNNEEKELEKVISGEKDTSPVEELDSTIIQSSCNTEKFTEESICDITESQTTTKFHAESQENAGDVESLPTGGDTEAHLEIQTDVQMFDSTIIEEGPEENICDDNVLMRHVEFVGDTVAVKSNMTIESDFLQNTTLLDTNQEALKSFETAQNNSAVTDTALPLKDDVLVGSGEKTEMSFNSDNSQGDSPSKLNSLAHKRKMGSTRRPLRGNKGKRKNAEEKEDGGSEGVEEEDTDLHSKTQEQNNVTDENIIKIIDVSDNEELERTETVRKSTQELCDDAVDKAEGHAEITSEQQLRSSSNICQTQDGSAQDDSESMLESEIDVREKKETENNDEEIFAFEDISSEVTVTPQAQNQLFIQTADEDIHDCIQTVKDVYEESGGDEMFLCTNTYAAFDSRNETKDGSKETEDLKEITNLIIQDTDSQLDLETENSKHNKVLTEEQNTNKTLHINVAERQETEHAENVFAVTYSGLSFGDSEESHKELENIIDIPEDSQKEEKQSKIKPLLHKRKMKGSKVQRKDKEQDAERETLNNEEKELEKEISGEKDTSPVEELDSTIIQSSCNAETFTEESICDITESQITTKCHAESQETAGDVASLPAGGDTEAHLEIQTDVQMFDSTIIEEGPEENICDDYVLMRQVEFVGDTFTVETNMTFESDFLQNNTSLDTNQEALKSCENAQNNSAVTDTALPLKDDVLVVPGETEAVSEEPEIRITSDNSQGDSPSKLNPLAHKRKMGSTRRPLRGNKEKRKNAEEKEDGGSEGVAEEDTNLHSETQEQNNVTDDNIIKIIDVSDNEELEKTETVRKSTQELCDDAVDKAEGHAEITSEQQLRSSSNICQTQDGSKQDDSENILKSETDVQEEKETENNDEEIFAFEDISSEVTVTPQAQNQLFIQTTDANSHDYIQTVKDVHEESQGKEMFLSANANFIIQDNDSQSDLQTVNSKQNKVLSGDQNTNTTPHMNLEESQDTELNVFAVTDSGLSFGDSGESHKELENIIDIPEDSQKEEKQSNIKPLVHKRKMGSTRRPLKGNTGQRKDKEQDDDSETLNNEEKELEKDISGVKVTSSVEELDSTIILSSCNTEKFTEESICGITESQTTTKFHAESQENAGDVESLPTGGDTEAHLEIQTDIKMFDSTMNKEGTEENICDDDVLMRQEAFKSSENVENVSAMTDCGILQQDVVLVGSGETEAVSEEPEISITSENSQRDSSPTLNLLAQKRKMGSTRRPLRGIKGQRKDREQDDENETLNSESLTTEEKSTEESICDITESQTTTKCHAESQETAGDVASLPTGGDTEAHLEIQTDVQMFDSTIIEEGPEENICDDNVLMGDVEFEALKSFETAQNNSAVTDTALPLKDDVLVGSGEKTEMSINSDNSQGDSPSKLNSLAHKRKMGSTRRPLRGNKEKRKNAEEKEDGGSEGVAEEDTNLHSETQEQNNVTDDNIIKIIDVSDNEELERTETVRKSTQELCDDAVDKAEGHAEITSEQQLRSSSNICQTQDGSKQDDSENILKSETDIQEEKETENNDEEIFAFEDISSEVTVTPQAQNQLFIQTTDANSHDYIQTVKDVHEESQGKEMFLSADANFIIQDNDSQSDLQTVNSKQNKVLSGDQNTNTTPHMNLEESQDTELNVFAVTDSGLSFGDSGESHKELENIIDIPEDSQKEEKQSNIKPLVHKRKMGSTRRPLKGNKGQRKDKEQDDDSETLNNEEKELEKDISGVKVTSSVEELDSTIILSSCNTEKFTEESICGITESQTTTKFHAESQENAGDVESLPTGGDTEAHLEIQTDIKMFDSTMNKEGTEENICDDDVLMRQVVFVGDTFTVESNMTIGSDLLQNNASLETHQEAFKSSENVENVSAMTDCGILQQDVVLVGSGETEAVSEEPEISITSENSQRDSSPTLNLLAQKRKMGSTRRPLRGIKGQRKDREQDDENETLNSESLTTEEKSTGESICDITESQTTTKCHAESQETAGDVASLPTGGDTEAHLEIQTDVQMFDSTIIEEGPEENICDDNVLMGDVEFEALKSFETAQNNSAVTDTALPLKDDVLVGSGEKTEMSINSDNSQGDSPSKLNPLAHKRKMGSTRRPLRGNKEKRKNAEEKEDGGSEGVAEEDTNLHSETQEQNNVTDDNIIKIIDVSDNEELERTETVRKSTQELCDDAVDKAEGHAEITSEQQLRSSSNICQTQDGSKQNDSENILKSETDVQEEKETENNDEEIFAFEDISSEVTVTPQAQNQLFIQTTDANSHDYIQTVKDVHEESQGKEMFLSANANFIIQDNDSQSDLQTVNSKQNKVLSDDQNTNTTPHMNLEESQETELNVFAVNDSGLSFGDSGESHKELENINDIPEDSQKVQSKLNPLVHKRKMGSTRRPPGGNIGQRKDREWHAEFQKNSGDVASVSVGGDTEAHSEFQTEIETFDSTVEDGKQDKICNDDVLMTQAEFVGDNLTGETNMTIESDFLLNNTSLDTNQEMLKSSENVENISTVIHSGLVLQEVATESSLESNTVPEKTEISIIPEDSHVEDSHSKLNPVVHKRKMGSTRRPLRGNKDKEDLREAKEEDMEPHSEIQEQNDVVDHDTMQKILDVRHNKEENSILRLPVQELCEHLSENKERLSDITLEQEQTFSSNISQTQTAPSQDDACRNLSEIQESTTFVLSEALLMEENQNHVSEPVVTVGTPQIEDGKIQSVFSRSVQKRKMGSTRKTQRGQRREKERELGEELDGETKNATTTEDTIKPQENFILEEVMSLTVTGTHAYQQPSSLPSNEEGHDIENNGSKMNNQTENPEQTEMQMQSDPNSNTNPHQNQDKSEILISEKSHSENIQSNMNTTAQKQKMGSTRKTLRGYGRRTPEVESKEIDGDSERTSEEHSTEFATVERAPETKLDENTQLKETRSTESLTHPVATSKIFFETEDGVKKVSTNIVGLSVVSEEIRTKEAPSEAFCRDIQSEMLVNPDEMKVGEKYDGPSGLENLDKSKSPEEVESKPQLQLTVLDQSHQMHSEKHPGSENVTPERKRKMGSTRKNLRGKREERKREESGSNQFAPEEDQDGETRKIRETEPDQIIHHSFEESDSSLLSEIERALRKTSPSSQNTDYQLIVNEPNLPKTPETSHFNTPENPEPEQGSEKEKYVSLQVTESQNQSEIGSPRRRRKMGSTRKNPRQQLQAEREDENEEDESEEKNKQESESLKKDREAAEESKMHDSRENAENKEYLDVPVALTNSCQTEESTNSAGQEGTSPQTKRKFGSRRTNVGKRDLGGLIPRESNDDLTEDTGARLVSLDQMIKASQHDGQTDGLKNISDMEVVQFNVVMVGNSSVGKTSFVRRFHGGEFSSDYSSTIVFLTIYDNVTQEKAPDDVIVMLLGNKNDCAGREVQVQEGEDLARDVNAAEETEDGGTHGIEESATTEEIWLLLR